MTNQTSSPDPHPSQPGSDEADPEKQTTPAGATRELEELADEQGGSTGPVDDD